MKRHLSLHSLTYNWRLKLAALGLAVLIWAAVSSEQETSQWIPIRVDAVVQDPEYVLAGAPDPAEVRVRFSGPGRELWELDASLGMSAGVMMAARSRLLRGEDEPRAVAAAAAGAAAGGGMAEF